MQKTALPPVSSMSFSPTLFEKVLRKFFACSNRRLRLSCEILLLARRRVGLGTIAINAKSLQKTKKLKSMESSKKSRLDTKALHDRCMGNIHFAEELLKAYFDTVQSDLAAFEKALARGDLLRIASMAHRIKRCSNKVGATADSIAAEKIELCCRSGQLEQLPLEIDAFRQVHLQTNSQWIIGNNSSNSAPVEHFAAG
jgi:HPt (histidine-containing phosphotransfer) domain-containing protein